MAKGTYLPRPQEKRFSAQSNRRAGHASRRLRQWALWAAIALGVLVSSPTGAGERKNEPTNELKYELSIEAGTADVTLKSLALQTGHSVIFQSDLVRSVRTDPIAGQYTVESALDALLSNTELCYALHCV